jgi:hypothetical protein
MILQNGWMFSVTSPAGLLEPPLWRVLRSVAKSTLRVGFRARFYNSRRENRSKRRGFPISIQFEWRYWLTNEHRAFHDPRLISRCSLSLRRFFLCPDIRFGSEADLALLTECVRFAPESRHPQPRDLGLQSANNRHAAREALRGTLRLQDYNREPNQQALLAPADSCRLILVALRKARSY